MPFFFCLRELFLLMSCSNLLNFKFLCFHLFFKNTSKTINNNIFLFRSMFLYNLFISLKMFVEIIFTVNVFSLIIAVLCYNWAGLVYYSRAVWLHLLFFLYCVSTRSVFSLILSVIEIVWLFYLRNLSKFEKFISSLSKRSVKNSLFSFFEKITNTNWDLHF